MHYYLFKMIQSNRYSTLSMMVSFTEQELKSPSSDRLYSAQIQQLTQKVQFDTNDCWWNNFNRCWLYQWKGCQQLFSELSVYGKSSIMSRGQRVCGDADLAKICHRSR
jgi:hypothetical protein